jgi:hypothetical protein
LSYSPQPNDTHNKRVMVFLNLAKSRLIVSSGVPASVVAVLTGNLPDPCHLQRIAAVSTSIPTNINIDRPVYTILQWHVSLP